MRFGIVRIEDDALLSVASTDPALLTGPDAIDTGIYEIVELPPAPTPVVEMDPE